MSKTLTTYLSHILGLHGDISRALAARASMKMLATVLAIEVNTALEAHTSIAS